MFKSSNICREESFYGIENFMEQTTRVNIQDVMDLILSWLITFSILTQASGLNEDQFILRIYTGS